LGLGDYFLDIGYFHELARHVCPSISTSDYFEKHRGESSPTSISASSKEEAKIQRHISQGDESEGPVVDSRILLDEVERSDRSVKEQGLLRSINRTTTQEEIRPLAPRRVFC